MVNVTAPDVLGDLDDSPFFRVSFGLIFGAAAVVFATLFSLYVRRKPTGGRTMQTISTIIHEGARQFLLTEYLYLSVFVAAMCVVVGLAMPRDDEDLTGLYTVICFIVGAILSALAGYIGMYIATISNVRTAQACTESLNAGLDVAFKSGAVMGLNVVGFGVLGVSVLYLIFEDFEGGGRELEWMFLSGFGFGASSIALFARVGGGVYTKAADVGADLVGKVENKIPEDDPRNPAVIADNVGDNVGDVAGMGADLFESYVGSIIAAGTLATTADMGQAMAKAGISAAYKNALVALPFWIAGFGIVASLVGIFLVRTSESGAEEEEEEGGAAAAAAAPKAGADGKHSGAYAAKLRSVRRVTDAAAIDVVLTAARFDLGLVAGDEVAPRGMPDAAKALNAAADELLGLRNYVLARRSTVKSQAAGAGSENEVLESLLGSIRFGIMVAAVLVVLFSVLVCFSLFAHAEEFAARMVGVIVIGLVAGNVIGTFTEYCTSYTFAPTKGIASKSNAGPAPVIIQGLGVGMISVVVPSVTLAAAILLSYELAGVYGISIAAVGMLSTLGVTLATDAYGPVADNAGGIAEMAPEEECPEEVRDRTDALDALGNTTAATGKGFAIGSAVLTAIGLIAAFIDSAGVTNIDLANSIVLSGVLIGAMLPYLFAALTMLSVGSSAEEIINEVRLQFYRKPQILTDFNYDLIADANELARAQKDASSPVPNYRACVSISTSAAIREMVVPGMLAIVSPAFVGFLLGARGLAGMLGGALTSGFMLAITMANAGGAWDNAKKYIEKDLLSDPLKYRGKHSENHAATVVGDTVGDPFKDTSGPSLNILIKLMSVISLVLAPTIKKHSSVEYTQTGWITALIIAVAAAFLCVVSIYFTSSARNRRHREVEAAYKKYGAALSAAAGEEDDADAEGGSASTPPLAAMAAPTSPLPPIPAADRRADATAAAAGDAKDDDEEEDGDAEDKPTGEGDVELSGMGAAAGGAAGPGAEEDGDDKEDKGAGAEV